MVPAGRGYYFACADAWEEMCEAEGVPAEQQSAAQEFMGQLITYSDYRQVLGEGAVFISVSPESAHRFAQLAKKVDFSVYRDAFCDLVSETTRATLMECADVSEKDQVVGAGFLRYVQQVVRAISLAAETQKGLVIHLF